MTQMAVNYGRILCETGVGPDDIKRAEQILRSVPEVKIVLANPELSLKKKERVIEKIFPQSLKNFFKVLCRNHDAELTDDIFRSYWRFYHEAHGILAGSLSFVAPPSEKQLEAIKNRLCERYGASSAELQKKQDKNLIGGFVIRIGDQEIDWSLKGRIEQLQQKLIRR